VAESNACGQCGELLTESANTSVENRQPCPKCGSTSRHVSLEFRGLVSVSGTATLTVITYPMALLTIAQSLIDQGHFNIAIVTSHIACEVAAERALDAAYAAKNLETLQDAVEGFMNGHNLAREQNRNLYNALTGTQIEKEPFWSRFMSAAKKRNKIVHGAGQATKKEAEDALQVAKELITHLKQL
jgi:hypothetical protein